MKRLMIATALTASLSTAAFAATQAELATVEGYLPSVNATALSDEQVTLSVDVINSDLPRAQKLSQLNAILTPGAVMATEAVPTEAQRADIQRYAPETNFEGLTQAQIDLAMQAINSGDSPAEIEGNVKSILETEAQPSYSAMPSEAERAEIERFAPGVDYSMLTQSQVDSALQAINGTDSPADTEAKVRTILNTDPTPVGTLNTASAAEVAILQRYIPNMAVDTLSEPQLNLALSIVYAGGSESDIRDKLQAMADS